MADFVHNTISDGATTILRWKCLFMRIAYRRHLFIHEYNMVSSAAFPYRMLEHRILCAFGCNDGREIWTYCGHRWRDRTHVHWNGKVQKLLYVRCTDTWSVLWSHLICVGPRKTTSEQSQRQSRAVMTTKHRPLRIDTLDNNTSKKKMTYTLCPESWDIHAAAESTNNHAENKRDQTINAWIRQTTKTVIQNNVCVSVTCAALPLTKQSQRHLKFWG